MDIFASTLKVNKQHIEHFSVMYFKNMDSESVLQSWYIAPINHIHFDTDYFMYLIKNIKLTVVVTAIDRGCLFLTQVFVCSWCCVYLTLKFVFNVTIISISSSKSHLCKLFHKINVKLKQINIFHWYLFLVK
jgi:hypothetical protein